MTDPGAFRTKLQYQTVSTVPDTVGQPIETWTDAFVAWARLRTLSAREQFYQQSMNSTATVEITCRYHPSITSTGRFKIVGTNRILNIFSINNFENRNTELTILAIEEV